MRPILPIVALLAFTSTAHAEPTMIGCTSLDHIIDAANEVESPFRPVKLSDAEAKTVIATVRGPDYAEMHFGGPVYWVDNPAQRRTEFSVTTQTSACLFVVRGEERAALIKRMSGDGI